MAVMVTALTRACPHIASPDFANAKLLSIILLFALGQAACALVFDKITTAHGGLSLKGCLLLTFYPW